MLKVVVSGFAGEGKTVLAKRISEFLRNELRMSVALKVEPLALAALEEPQFRAAMLASMSEREVLVTTAQLQLEPNTGRAASSYVPF